MNWNVHVHVAYRSIYVLILAGQYIGLCWLHIALPLPVTDHWYWHITPYTEIHKTSVGLNIHSTDSLLIQIWTYDCWKSWWILQIVTSVISWDVSEYSVGPSDNMSANRWAAVILHKKSSLHCVNRLQHFLVQTLRALSHDICFLCGTVEDTLDAHLICLLLMR